MSTAIGNRAVDTGGSRYSATVVTGPVADEGPGFVKSRGQTRKFRVLVL